MGNDSTRLDISHTLMNVSEEIDEKRRLWLGLKIRGWLDVLGQIKGAFCH